MTEPERNTLKGAMNVAIRSLGSSRCSELCGDCSETTVYRYANPNEPHIVPAHFALDLDRACWLRDGIAPFREVFEANAGEPFDARVARQLRSMADSMSGAA